MLTKSPLVGNHLPVVSVTCYVSVSVSRVTTRNTIFSSFFPMLIFLDLYFEGTLFSKSAFAQMSLNSMFSYISVEGGGAFRYIHTN